MKYVMFKNNFREFPVIFPDSITHSELAGMINAKPVSAGFFSCSEPTTSGRSTSLNLQSRPEDSDIIQSELYGY